MIREDDFRRKPVGTKKEGWIFKGNLGKVYRYTFEVCAITRFNGMVGTEIKIKNKHGKPINPPKRYEYYYIFDTREEAEKHREKAIKIRAADALNEATYELQKVTSHIKAIENEDILKEFISIKNSLKKLITKLK
jgi:hypothetical protein